MTEPVQVVPPDDTGSDTFARFKYQAHVTVPYCLDLARGEEITSVFAEHVEDIAVEVGGSWRFLLLELKRGTEPERVHACEQLLTTEAQRRLRP